MAGNIHVRYGKALLEYAEAKGDVEDVVRQSLVLENTLAASRELDLLLTDPSAVTDERKRSLIEAALSDTGISESLGNFIGLLLKNGRIGEIRRILLSFTDQFYKSRNIRLADLVTAVEASERLCSKLEEIAVRLVGGKVIVRKVVNPDIIGGFVFTIDGCRFDASVSGQIEELRKEYTEKNRRII